MIATIPGVIFHFGPFELDAERYALASGGEELEVEPRVLEVLVHLVTHRRRVVGKEELVEEVWGGKHVTDSALTRAVAEARRVLGDSAAESRWIRTVYGRGFTFEGAVREASREGAGAEFAAGVAAGAAADGPGEEDGGRPGSGPGPLAGSGLPARVSTLVGRQRELARLEELLEEARLVTLTGPAGTGKTRLALEAARLCAGRFPAGAVFVPLAEVEDPERFPRAVLRALEDGGGPGEPFARLLARLRERRVLLLLDNLEHLAPAAPRVAELLRACPGVTVLATSRFVLHLEGERELPVLPLALGGGGEASASPAVALFLARARAADPGFSPDAESLDYVAEVCRRLDGLPLAIELAAPWVKMLAPREIWQRLARRLDLLSARGGDRPKRHRSLVQAMAWSYGLITAEERALLRRLSVFAGTFGLEAADRVAAAPAGLDALPLLGALVDKSLVQPRRGWGGEGRFALLETTRRFAREKLAEEGEEEAARGHHAAWVLDLVRRAEPEIAAGDQATWLRRLDAAAPEVAAALAWCREAGELATGLEVAAAVGRYHSARGTYREGAEELEALLAHPEAEGVPAAARASALTAHGMLLHLMSDYDAALPRLEESLELRRGLGDEGGAAEVMNHLAWVTAHLFHLDRAEAMAREAAEIHRRTGDLRGRAVAENVLAWIAMFRDDWAGAEERWHRALKLRRRLGDRRGVAFTLSNLALALHQGGGDGGDARRFLTEAREIVERLEDRPQLGWLSSMEALWMAAGGETGEAVDCLEAACRIMAEVGQPDGQAWALLFLAEIHEDRGETELARTRFEECLRLWRPRRHRWGVARVEAGLARLAGGGE